MYVINGWINGIEKQYVLGNKAESKSEFYGVACLEYHKLLLGN